MRACGGCCHDSYVNTSTAALLQSLLLHSYSTLWCTLGIYWNEEERKRGRRRMSWEKEETRLLSPLTHSGKHGASSLDFPSSFRLANFPYCYYVRGFSELNAGTSSSTSSSCYDLLFIWIECTGPRVKWEMQNNRT